jgi:hypothetical protein
VLLIDPGYVFACGTMAGNVIHAFGHQPFVPAKKKAFELGMLPCSKAFFFHGRGGEI